MPHATHILRTMEHSCAKMRDRLKELSFRPEDEKTLNIIIGPTAAAELLGRTTAALAKAEAQGRLPQPRTFPQNGRRYYTVEDLNTIRDLMKIPVGKAKGEKAVVLAVQNFKGGVGKSTITKHLADYLGLHGYRVLVIDMDPQASTTTMFGIKPETLIDEKNILGNFLSPRMNVDDFRSCIRRTCWPRTDIVPSDLSLQDAEWDLTGSFREDGTAVISAFQALKRGVDQVTEDYDVVLIDPPPALGFLGLNSVAASNALIIPVPPKQLDYLSTIHFFNTIADNLELFESVGINAEYGFIKTVCSMFQPNRPGEADMWTIMKATHAGNMISQPILQSEEIKNALATFQSVYEANKGSGSSQTYQRCRQNLDAVFGEIEQHIKDQWPSHSISAIDPVIGEAA